MQALKQHVTKLANDPAFIHHQWFVRWHLQVVEQIASELLERYPQADRLLVEAMVWMHDYGKILHFEKQHDRELVDAGRDKLVELGFNKAFANKVADYIAWMDKRATVDLHKAPLEVQIVSSADGCSHFASPFHASYYYENPDTPIEDIIAQKPQRISLDWDRKITLPEARQVFEPYYHVTMVQNGVFPEKFLDGASI